jgi:hypothetical protein
MDVRGQPCGWGISKHAIAKEVTKIVKLFSYIEARRDVVSSNVKCKERRVVGLCPTGGRKREKVKEKEVYAVRCMNVVSNVTGEDFEDQ